ncbi:hypothetical protein FRB99_005715 [Tulasnella sp. 403]|nr:hypothetical protein FRB99_005715 [Tulasnella sp. 403]
MQYQGGATTTPSRSRPSGLPTPGRSSMGSGIPTPGSRPRSSASGYLSQDGGSLFYSTSKADEMLALSDAIRANDPAAHRSNPPSVGMASPALSESGFNFSGGGTLPRKSTGTRPSFARPSSSASASTDPSIHTNGLRSKTPTIPTPRYTPRTSTASNASSFAGRPESVDGETHSGRQLFSAADRDRMLRGEWHINDPVRIESLGVEGHVRFLGPIDGKPGVYAGVELLPGFAGKGKNDGSVAGVHYFTCSPQCGVFVVPTKLSLSTVSFPSRTPSVASSRGGLHASGRQTPPSSKPRNPTTPAARKLAPPVNGASTPGMPTPGSRASKYVGMTAKQLSSARNGMTSPTRPQVPASTPSLATPRAIRPVNGVSTPGRRLTTGTPSSAARSRTSGPFGGPPLPAMLPPPDPVSPTRRPLMPPPPSPRRQTRDKLLTPTLSQTSTDTYVDGDAHASDSGTYLNGIEANSRVLQDKIARLMEGKKSPPSPSTGLSSSVSSVPNGVSSSSAQLMQMQIERLTAQVESLEKENETLRSTVDKAPVSPAAPAVDVDGLQSELSDANQRIQSLKEEHELTLSRLSASQAEHSMALRSLEDKQSTIDTLTKSNTTLGSQVTSLQDAARESELKVRDLVATVDEKEELVRTLKDAVDTKTSKEGETAAAIKAKDTEITLLESRLKRTQTELDDERRELGTQVDELRKAGQETIALYEERIAHYEARRYETEEIIQDLESKLQQLIERPPSPGTLAKHANAATQIENESLKEQLTHLQQKLSSLEDQMEEMRMTSEKDEQVVKNRITRFRETESTLRKDLEEARKESERLLSAETTARLKIAEVEEAFRENDAALENARAEIESLRTELANHEGAHEGEQADATERIADAAKKAAAERQRLMDELVSLKQTLDQTRSDHREALQEAEIAANRLVVVTKTVDELRARVQSLEGDRDDLERSLQEEAEKLQTERGRVAHLQLILEASADNRGSSAAGYLKDLHLHDPRRDSAASGSSRMSRRSTDPNSEDNIKEQVKGLKHINAELRKENSGLASQVKVLESESKIHMAEIEELRESMKTLENTLQETIDKEEKALDAAENAPEKTDDSEDPSAMIKALKLWTHAGKHLKVELEQLQKKISEMEKEHTKVVHSLNKDILDLENLVEAKIYREDDLEREIERLNEKLSRRRSRKASGDSLRMPDVRPQSRGSTVSADTRNTEEVICEVCGDRGHDLVSCETLGFGDSQETPQAFTTPAKPAETIVTTEEAEQDLWGYDHPPTKQEDKMSRKMSWVLNGEKIRADYKERKRKQEEEDKRRAAKRRRVEDNTKDLTLKAGETLEEFNNRVEEEWKGKMSEAFKTVHTKRPDLVSESRKDKKATPNPVTSPSKGASERNSSQQPSQQPSRTGKTEFERAPTRRSVRDIVDAPPELTKLPRKASGATASGKLPVSAVQQRLMARERERVIEHYRALKKRKDQS